MKSAENKFSPVTAMPVVAVVLDILPALWVLLGLTANSSIMSPVFLLVLLAPIAGMLLGVISICRGREKTGKAGMILAVIAVALPLALIAGVILFFIGAMTGIIPLM